MARLAITVGFRHEDRKPVVVTGPEVPLADHRTGLQALQASPTHPDFCQVEVWTSDGGMLRRKKFTKAAPAAPQKPDPKKDSTPPGEKTKQPADKPAKK